MDRFIRLRQWIDRSVSLQIHYLDEPFCGHSRLRILKE